MRVLNRRSALSSHALQRERLGAQERERAALEARQVVRSPTAARAGSVVVELEQRQAVGQQRERLESLAGAGGRLARRPALGAEVRSAPQLRPVSHFLTRFVDGLADLSQVAGVGRHGGHLSQNAQVVPLVLVLRRVLIRWFLKT